MVVTLRNDMPETRQHYNITLGVLTLAATAYAIQQTMVVPALPELQRELGASRRRTRGPTETSSAPRRPG